MTATIILGICLTLSIASNFLLAYFLTKEHSKEKAQLHDRLMVRDYPEFMEGKDFQVELDKKKEEMKKGEPEKPKMSAAEYSDLLAAEKH